MAKTIQFKRGTTAQVNAFTGAVGEIVVDTDKDTIVVHDGSTQGGFPVAARANNDGSISFINKVGTVVTTVPASGLFNDTLTSTSTSQGLTAAQGKYLQDNKLNISDAISSAKTLTDVTSSRILNTVYTNSTTSPIFIMVQGTMVNPTDYQGTMELTVNGVTLARQTATTGYAKNQTVHATLYAIILPNQTYKVTSLNSMSILTWWELR